MDTQELVSNIKTRFNHRESKLYLEEKYKNQLIFACQGGTWQITMELLAFLRTSSNKTILIDYYNNPVEVETQELLESATATYNSVMSTWHKEYQELIKKR
jgi:hypothetical protein